MTGLIPFSGAIVFVLSAIALIKTWWTWYTLVVIFSSLLALDLANALAKGRVSVRIVAIWQDVWCAIAVYGIWWFK